MKTRTLPAASSAPSISTESLTSADRANSVHHEMTQVETATPGLRGERQEGEAGCGWDGKESGGFLPPALEDQR